MQLLPATITKLSLPLPQIPQTAVEAAPNMQPATDQNRKPSEVKHQIPSTMQLQIAGHCLGRKHVQS